jgi:hypothetical protein
VPIQTANKTSFFPLTIRQINGHSVLTFFVPVTLTFFFDENQLFFIGLDPHHVIGLGFKICVLLFVLLFVWVDNLTVLEDQKQAVLELWS